MAGLRVLIVGAGMTAAGAAKGILRRYPAADISVWEQVRHQGTQALLLLCSAVTLAAVVMLRPPLSAAGWKR